MKKTVIFLLLTVLSFSAYSQTKNKSVAYPPNTSKNIKGSSLFIQIIGLEQIDGNSIKFIVKIGDENKFYIQNDREFEVFDQIQSEVSSYQTLPDVLNYLKSKGFELEYYTSIALDGMLRHDMIFSFATN